MWGSPTRHRPRAASHSIELIKKKGEKETGVDRPAFFVFVFRGGVPPTSQFNSVVRMATQGARAGHNARPKSGSASAIEASTCARVDAPTDRLDTQPNDDRVGARHASRSMEEDEEELLLRLGLLPLADQVAQDLAGFDVHPDRGTRTMQFIYTCGGTGAD